MGCISCSSLLAPNLFLLLILSLPFSLSKLQTPASRVESFSSSIQLPHNSIKLISESRSTEIASESLSSSFLKLSGRFIRLLNLLRQSSEAKVKTVIGRGKSFVSSFSSSVPDPDPSIRLINSPAPPFTVSESAPEEGNSVSSFISADSIRPPPLPIPPLPSAAQLSWQLAEMALFLHFGMNTFADAEWGSGSADPSVFDPGPTLNCSQWVDVAKSAGFSRVILTAKHHDGFCLWPSAYTNYTVEASPWKNSRGDVVADLAAAARQAGLGLGLYLSPWDRHEASFGKTLEYNEFYMGQMTELLTSYGEIEEVFLDGAKGKGEKDMEYFFESWFELVHQLQPGACIFTDAGPDIRWIGNENGISGSTCWSIFNRSAVIIGGDNDIEYTCCGDPHAHSWVPSECDVSIRPDWFWHSSEKPKPASTLLDLYYKSVGRNCLFLLNVPPNSSGLISEDDIQVIRNFTEMRHIIFSKNLAENASVHASSTRAVRFSPYNILEQGIFTYWAPEENQSVWSVSLNLREPISFNLLQVQEPIHMGQGISWFHLDVLKEGEWQTVANGTTVGYKRLLLFPEVKSQWLRLVIEKSRADPLISCLGIYLDPFSTIDNTSTVGSSGYTSSHVQMKSRNFSSNGSIAEV